MIHSSGPGSRRLTFLVLAAGTGFYAMLQSLITPVLPTIQHDLHTSPNTVTWVLTAYLLSASVFTPIIGRIGDMVGKEKTLVFSLAGFLYFGLGIVSGPLADRWGSRRLAVIGMILTGTGLAVASAARSLTEVYAAYGLGVGLGVGCAYVPAVGAVQRWFVRRRGFASGLAVSGIGVGTLVMPPLASLLIEIVKLQTLDAAARAPFFRAADTIDSGVCHMAPFADPDGNALMFHHRYAPADAGPTAG